jgi:hypothetical protein
MRKRYVAFIGYMSKAYEIFFGKPKRKRPLGRHRRRWEHDIQIILKEIVCGSVDWNNMTQNWDK